MNQASKPSTSFRNTAVNVFYSWYNDLCHRQKTNPLQALRAQFNRNEYVLRFNTDKIKTEDWQPIIDALRSDESLHVISVQSHLNTQKFSEEADTADKAKRTQQWLEAISTKYILTNFLKSIDSCLRSSEVLTCLELDGLRINQDYLKYILKGLLQNRSLKYLSFQSSPIEDDGCLDICQTLYQIPHVEVLCLAGCALTSTGAGYIAKLLNFQQIDRYCKSQQEFLENQEQVEDNIGGLKRISINNNPKIGDTGFQQILKEIANDFWMIAIDAQRCNLTEKITAEAIDTLECTKSLQIFDLRNNQLSKTSMNKILNIIHTRQKNDTNGEYNLCTSTTSLDTTICSSYICLLNKKSNTKNKLVSATMSHLSTRKSKDKVKGKNPNNSKPAKDISDDENVIIVYEKLKQEIKWRQEAESRSVELERLFEILSSEDTRELALEELLRVHNNLKECINFIECTTNRVEYRDFMIRNLKIILNEVSEICRPIQAASNSEFPLYAPSTSSHSSISATTTYRNSAAADNAEEEQRSADFTTTNENSAVLGSVENSVDFQKNFSNLSMYFSSVQSEQFSDNGSETPQPQAEVNESMESLRIEDDWTTVDNMTIDESSQRK